MTRLLLKTALVASAAALVPSTGSATVLEPDAREFAAAADAGTPIYTLPYEDAREVLRNVQADTIEASASTTTQDLVWNIGPTGTVTVRIVRPENASGPLPVIVYLHGGGWVLGDRNTHDHLIRELAVQAQAAVVFVEYGNAPEVQYPVNNEQAYAALKHVAAHGAEIGLDPERIALAGDSVGGNMAIALTLMAKDRGGPALRHQLLFYPVTDDVSDNASYSRFADGPFLTRKAMEYFIDANISVEDREDMLAFPLHAPIEQLTGLPAATIITAENDVLRDEGEAYGRRLLAAGVPVTSTRYNGTIHDFVMLNPLAESHAARAAIRQGAAQLRAAFAN